MDLTQLSSLFYYLSALFGATLVALWLSLVFWTYRDIRSRSYDRLIQILAALVPAFLGPLGLVVYLVLRPPQTLEEVYERTLEEEALLSQIEDRIVCPGCSSRMQNGWQVCPKCLTRVRKPCLRCDRLLELNWQICPYCATPVPGARPEAAAP